MNSSLKAANQNSLSPVIHSKPPSVLLLGHRGARGEFIENSQHGFQKVQQFYLKSLQTTHTTAHLGNKANRRLIGIEFDVQLTADDQLVVVHDDTLERFYQLQARIDELSYAQITKLTHTNLPIMRLQELLPLLLSYQRIELEIKTHSRSQPQKIVKALLNTFESLKSKGIDPYQLPITLTSFDQSLHTCLQRSSHFTAFCRGLLIEENENPDKINLAQRLGCHHLGMHHAIITAELITRCKQAQVTTSAWTVNDAKKIDYLASIGVDFIITDYPCLYSSYK